MAMFRVQDKKEPDKERRLSSLYLIKFKKKEPEVEKNFEEEQKKKNPVLDNTPPE